MSPIVAPQTDLTDRVRTLLGTRDTTNLYTNQVISNCANLAAMQIRSWVKLQGTAAVSTLGEGGGNAKVLVAAGTFAIQRGTGTNKLAADTEIIYGVGWYANGEYTRLEPITEQELQRKTGNEFGTGTETGTPIQYWWNYSTVLNLYPTPDRAGEVFYSYLGGYGVNPTSVAGQALTQWHVFKTVLLCAMRGKEPLEGWLMADKQAQEYAWAVLQTQREEAEEMPDGNPWQC
jgi:hypothetical protein